MQFLFFGQLAEHVPQAHGNIALDKDESLGELLVKLGVSNQTLIYTKAALNGELSPLDARVCDNDCIEVFQPVGGG